MNLNLASTEDDIRVFLGPDGECDVDDLEIDVLRCQLPDKQPQAGDLNGTLDQGAARNLPAVTVSWCPFARFCLLLCKKSSSIYNAKL